MNTRIPSITTVWPCNDRADPQRTVRRIQQKLREQGQISAREQAFVEKHLGKIDQKRVFS